MLNTALLLVVASGAPTQVVGAAYPDQLDLLRGADTRAQIEMVLDTSGSMSWDSIPTSCADYYGRVLGLSGNPAFPLNRMGMLKAVLTGCQTANDGVLDQWANRVFFAVREFSSGTSSIPAGGGFSPTLNNLTALEAAVLGLTPGGGTPLARGFADAANHISNYFNDLNSVQCRQNFIVLMTDGDGNENTTHTLSIGAGNAAVTFQDDRLGAAPTPYTDMAARHIARSDSSWTTYVDSLPNVTGIQPIRTYTIGFGNTMAATSQTLMQNIATNGDGQYYPAVSYQQLNNAFTQIILSIVARTNVNFQAPTIQTDGLFSGNFVYASGFKPNDAGPWFGTTKKHCMMPANATDTTCVLMDDGAGNLITNPSPVDIWTSTNVPDADIGGTGQMIWRNLFGGVTSVNSPVPANPLSRRRILTWRPGSAAYVPVDGTGAWTRADSFAPNDCEHFSLINRLHGYTYAVQDCAGGNFAPVALEKWPIADSVNGDTVLMKYSQACEGGGDSCWLASVSNDGMLHFFNARTGVESSAVIPGQLWGNNQVATHQLRDMMNQPNLNELRKFYFDGGMRLYHDDANANGYIDNGESAKLIAGLGRGGKSYVMWDVSSFNGVPSAANNPPQELMADQSTSFKHLRETWNPPWLGRYRHNDNTIYDVGVFASGHDRALDVPTANFGALIGGLPQPPADSHASPNVRGCPAFFSQLGPAGAAGSVLCNPPLPPIACTPCNNPGGCIGLIMCYDWPGWMGNAIAFPFDSSAGPPSVPGAAAGHDLLFGPFSWSDAQHQAIGYQMVFNKLDLQAGDYIAFLDSQMNEVGRLTGSYPGTIAGPWIDDSSFHVRFKTDGLDSGPTTGFSLQRVNLVRTPLPGQTSGTWRPTIYMVDINKWNGPANAAAGKFPTRPAAGDTRQQTSVLLRITSDCEGLQGAGEVCLDAVGGGGQPAQPDLAFMTCPISMEPSVLDEGGLAEGIYWGDECGQIFRATRDIAGVWSAKRLLHANNVQATNASVTGASKDFRKIFANLELVRSTCTGARSVGVYFGTGNMQRPAFFDNLQDPAVADFAGRQAPIVRDVLGVVWDNATLPVNASLDHLENVTYNVQVADPRANLARNGWIIETDKVLRAPLVFDGSAYFRTYRVSTAATECVSATGSERTLIMDNCTARPTADGNGNGTVADSSADRFVETTQLDIGGEMSLYTPPDAPAMVLTGGTTPKQSNRPTGNRFLMWRTNVDPLF